jgi:hypothetical protein
MVTCIVGIAGTGTPHITMTATMGMGMVPRSGCTSAGVVATSAMVIAADTPGPAQMPAPLKLP